MNTDGSALLVAEPGPLRDSLYTMLNEILQIGAVGQASDVASAWKAITDRQPALVLLDASLGYNDVMVLLSRLEKEPRCRSLVLADNIHQKTDIQAAGADVVLIKGFPAEKLYGEIVQLLHDS